MQFNERTRSGFSYYVGNLELLKKKKSEFYKIVRARSLVRLLSEETIFLLLSLFASTRSIIESKPTESVSE
jgi:hypothetical protein